MIAAANPQIGLLASYHKSVIQFLPLERAGFPAHSGMPGPSPVRGATRTRIPFPRDSAFEPAVREQQAPPRRACCVRLNHTLVRGS